MKTRNQIQEKYKWDLSTFGVTDENFLDKCEKAKKYMEKIYALDGKLNSDEDLIKLFKLEDGLEELLDPIGIYVHFKQCEDLSLSKYDEMEDYIDKMIVEYDQKTLFIDKKLKKLPLNKINELLNNKKFAPWRLRLEDLRDEKKHQLHDAVDKFLAGADFLHSNSGIMRKLSDVDMTFEDVEDGKGKKHEFNESILSSFLESDDRVLRRNALKTLHGTYGKFINTFSANYIASVKERCCFSKARKYKSAISRSMQEEKVSESVYGMLVENVRKALPILFDYFEFKREKLGLKDFWNYDTYAAIDCGSKKKYTYEEAIELIKKAVAPLGEEYVALIDRAKDERWIDVYPNKNKRTGAFESAIYGYHPFVLTNFNDGLESVFTLAHELGHAMHSYYSDKTQDREKSQYTIFVAEVASTTNEMLLLNYLLGAAKTKAQREELYNKLFDSVKSTIFRQTMFAEFEEKVHAIHEEGGALSKDKLCDLYYSLNKDYFGKKVKLLDEVKYEWARIPHFFTAFYVYKYAIGLICALNFANKLYNGEKGAREKYIKNFLCAGCSKKPVEILKDAGCDLEDEKTYIDTFEFLKKKLDEWKKL